MAGGMFLEIHSDYPQCPQTQMATKERKRRKTKRVVDLKRGQMQYMHIREAKNTPKYQLMTWVNLYLQARLPRWW